MTATNKRNCCTTLKNSENIRYVEKSVHLWRDFREKSVIISKKYKK